MLNLSTLSGTPPEITPQLVSQLLSSQFPHLAHLPIAPADPQGWDNRTFRLGDTLSVRLPSAAGYVPQVEKEHRWLPFLAPQLPLPIPVPLERGQPGEGYPFPWSVYGWLEGEVCTLERVSDLPRFARDLADFLKALQSVDAVNGPPPGLHSAYRGGPLEFYASDVYAALETLGDRVDAGAARALWDRALEAKFDGPPVWFHGDVASNNLLVKGGKLSAVLDFGCAGVGDPACDLTIAWTLLEGEARAAFRAALPLDAGTWARGAGWTLWKALITQAGQSDGASVGAARRVLGEVLADPLVQVG